MLNQISGNDYENYRWFFTSSGTLVVGGKSDKQNENVLKNFLKPNYIVMHTNKPGSAFMIIQSDRPSNKDLKETSVVTACFSQQWKKANGKNIEVDMFKAPQIFKNKFMKTGTFGVRGSKRIFKVKPELSLVLQKGKLRAVSNSTKEKILVSITPGKSTKEEATEKIFKTIKDKFHLLVSKEEIMRAIPSDKLSIK